MTATTNIALGELLTVTQAARVVRVSEVTVRRLVRRGELPGLRVGRQWRISADGLATPARIGRNPKRGR